MSFNKMTIKENKVFKLKIGQTGTPTDMANCKKYFYLPSYATARFEGSFKDCMNYIRNNSAEYIEI